MEVARAPPVGDPRREGACRKPLRRFTAPGVAGPPKERRGHVGIIHTITHGRDAAMGGRDAVMIRRVSLVMMECSAGILNWEW